MKRTFLLSIAALVLVLMYNIYVGRAEEPDPRILWVSDSAVGRIDDIIVQPNGNIIGNYGGTIKEIDGTNGKLIRSFQNVTSQNMINTIDLSDDGRFLLCSYDEVVLVDLITNEKNVVASGGRAKFCKGTNKIAYRSLSDPPSTMGDDSCIVILDLVNGERNYIKIKQLIEGIAFSPNGSILATGGSGQDYLGNGYTALNLWDAKTFQHLKLLEYIENGSNPSTRIAFSPDSKKVGFIQHPYLKIFNTITYSKINEYEKLGVNFTFITNELIGIQGEKTTIIRLTDDKITVLKDFSTRAKLMGINQTRDVLYAGTGDQQYDGSLIAWDLNKILSSIPSEQTNLHIHTEYIDGVITISNVPEKSNFSDLKILDLQGKVIETLTNIQNTYGKIELNIKLPVGIYILQIKNGNKEYASKFIVLE